MNHPLVQAWEAAAVSKSEKPLLGFSQYQKAVVFLKVERIEPEPEDESGPNRI